ncbi:MAG: Asp23/Gls24 family envelope stress response protein [Clostridiales bacterium]|uniref:Asp23/Gls24 family envelope stress response protein n=1 Tax=Candidatus Scybalenecus merdavium TaxID=2840939 RepID=A0A9D1SN79_9FIRM|nr:Asp23/Gls24 family envelope stress response protein [Clostridiales bacterium]HIU68839.1 Asp23/Gls24 family envelope stress response protein [Candidatus Scubalenecus merdavium]
MIRTENANGYIEITNNYFSKLVGKTASSCFGVAGMVSSTPAQAIKSALKGRYDLDTTNQGVNVRSENGLLTIDLHIAVTYGINISAIVSSIVNKVRYTIEEATDLKVEAVNVYVDQLKN